MDFDKSLIATLNTLEKNNKNPFQDGGKRIKETFLSEAEKPRYRHIVNDDGPLEAMRERELSDGTVRKIGCEELNWSHDH